LASRSNSTGWFCGCSTRMPTTRTSPICVCPPHVLPYPNQTCPDVAVEHQAAEHKLSPEV
jgi:Asp-tRNA(Asn)/Glu-tRNA(Gln) amidotransferase B subunit